MHQANSTPLTLQEHRELSLELKAARARLAQLCQLVLAVYGPNNHAAFTFAKAIEALDRLSTDMRSQAGHDCSGAPIDDLY
jgi:hypothetical protein